MLLPVTQSLKLGLDMNFEKEKKIRLRKNNIFPKSLLIIYIYMYQKLEGKSVSKIVQK